MDIKADTLARGYIKDGEIWFHISAPTFKGVTIHQQLGVDLLNFVWLDKSLIKENFELLYKRYIALASARFSYDAVMDDLLKFLGPLLGKNTYLDVYIIKAIEYLVSDGKDKDTLSQVAACMGIEYVELIEAYDLDDLKGFALSKLPEVIAYQQEFLNDVIEISIGDTSDLKAFTPAQRLYILTNFKEYREVYYNMQFHSSLNTTFDFRDMDEAAVRSAITENNIEFFEMYDLPTVDDMLRFELVQMILHECSFKRCKYCGKYFISLGRSDSEYCSRIMPDETKPCREIGASRIRTAKLQTDPILKAYKKAYSRMDSQKRCGSISQKEFNDWSWQAIEKRDHCLAGEISSDEFQEWLDNTKKRL
jgi:hypothetical protein